ncbi:MAG TPA: ChbG/HpnK family deacetylase [Solirubrobacterales bacterium]|nr:ChbG/HpnK family deacetylase [Solirubrobacterales bacterium]
MARVRGRPGLIITADDYGYARGYDEGIVEAAGARALDAVSAMVLREGIDPEPLLGTGSEIGLHLELPPEVTGGARAGKRERELAVGALREQLARFESMFGRPPAHLDGHHHCHAHPGLASAIAREAASRGLPVRSVGDAHRALLRRHHVRTADRLVGRFSEEAEAALPIELRPVVEDGGELPPGLTEWMVHPGHRDPESGSGYDQAREEDLDLLLGLSLDPALSAARLTHAAAFG